MKNSIILYFEQYEAIKGLSSEYKGLILDAIFYYAMNGKDPENLPPMVSMAFAFIKTSIDFNSKKYESTCEKNKNNINKRWGKSKDTTVYDRIQIIQANTNHTDKDKDKDTDKDTDKEKSTNVDKKKESPDSSCSQEYQNFISWMEKHAPYCSNPKNLKQITEQELIKLKVNYTGKQVADVIEQIENRKDLRKRYSSLYKTVLNWAKKEYG